MSVQIGWQMSGVTAPTVVLSDPAGAYGVRRADTLATVVAAGTAMTLSGGVWTHTFAEPSTNLVYEYWVRVTPQGGSPFWVRGTTHGAEPLPSHGTLGGCRRLLVETSGRYDLVRDAANGDYTDAGRANLYLNQAQKWLDRRLGHHKSLARLYKTLGAGETLIPFERARFVREVWEQAAGGLRRVPWTTAVIGLAPEQAGATAESLPEAAGSVMFGNHWAHKGVVVAPSETERALIIEAEWHSPELAADGDLSFWTLEEPLLLVHAAMLLLEVGMRNTQGVNDLAGPVGDDVRNIHNDLRAEEAAGPASRWRMR